jgi:hypothetical protein
MQLVLAAQLLFTLFMVGLIWFVQIVHYPLFAAVGKEEFKEFEQAHQRLTTWVVAPVMLLELATAVALVALIPPVQQALSWMGLFLLAVVWISTWLLQVPAHTALAAGFTLEAHRRLVITNWIRTIAWSGRGLIILTLSLQSFAD